MNPIEIAFYPIIFSMKLVLELGYSIFSSYGLAIVFLSIVVSILTYPISAWASRIQARNNELANRMAPKIAAAKSEFRGEKQFLEIEKIYMEHNYHPIHAMKSVLGIAPQIPFLLSALFLLWSYPALQQQPFLFLNDLSQPDALLKLPEGSKYQTINVLPLAMVAIAFFDSLFKADMNVSAKIKSNVINLVLFVLVYPLPSAVLLYWTSNNAISAIITVVKSTRRFNS